ncbi:hypothetical protein BC940DRAFT_289105 [Gongronella butleri]|nr:hypothetical protein BC940DRAFT_289105 [Gongronella butleri]
MTSWPLLPPYSIHAMIKMIAFSSLFCSFFSLHLFFYYYLPLYIAVFIFFIVTHARTHTITHTHTHIFFVSIIMISRPNNLPIIQGATPHSSSYISHLTSGIQKNSSVSRRDLLLKMAQHEYARQLARYTQARLHQIPANCHGNPAVANATPNAKFQRNGNLTS